MPSGLVLVMLVPTAWTELCEPLPASVPNRVEDRENTNADAGE